MKTTDCQHPTQEIAPTEGDDPKAWGEDTLQVQSHDNGNCRTATEDLDSCSDHDGPATKAKSPYFLKSLAKIKAEGVRPTYPLGAFCIFLQERRRQLIDKQTPSKFYSSSHLRLEWRKLKDKARFQVEARKNYKEYKQLMKIWRRRTEGRAAEVSRPITRPPKPSDGENPNQKSQIQCGSIATRAGSDHFLKPTSKDHGRALVSGGEARGRGSASNLGRTRAQVQAVQVAAGLFLDQDQLIPFPLKELPPSQVMENLLNFNAPVLAQPDGLFPSKQLHAGALAPTLKSRPPSNFRFEPSASEPSQTQSICKTFMPQVRSQGLTINRGRQALVIGPFFGGHQPSTSRHPGVSAQVKCVKLPYLSDVLEGKPALFNRLVEVSTDPGC